MINDDILPVCNNTHNIQFTTCKNNLEKQKVSEKYLGQPMNKLVHQLNLFYSKSFATRGFALTLCTWEIPKGVLWKTVKKQMKCRKMFSSGSALFAKINTIFMD